MWNMRKNRGETQRLYLLDCKYENPVWSFSVKGLTNIYNLIIDPNFISCSCKDFINRMRICKHLYFIISRIAKNNKIANNLEIIDIQTNNSYPSIRKEDIKILTINLISRLKTRFNKIENDNINEEKIDTKHKIDDVDCPICYENINSSNEKIIQCKKQCKHYFHQECLLLWINTNPSCPLCRIKITKSEINHNFNNKTSDLDDPMCMLTSTNIKGIL